MTELSPEDLEDLAALLEENGGVAMLQRYIDEVFSPTIIRMKRITIDNAEEWIDLAKFTDWIVAASQQRPRTSSTPFRSISNTSSEQDAYRTCNAISSPESYCNAQIYCNALASPELLASSFVSSGLYTEAATFVTSP
ncbi:hypothetical protein BD626DRAFT_96388 [Schizophyllum amplum]|uniref:Uncharacterized protein n=1 Tax=Schizophyllum amplum TaxID=97359 RepID=A0A550C866_9AGAR|nr:hypothetical protein BD626DRAFT_96388 [Auriculariopsis ampla]